MTIKLIVGLGNPGDQYVDTRHNIGFKFINQLIKCSQSDVVKKVKHKSQLYKIILQGQPVMCIKPQTYMNLSGDAVRLVADFYQIKPTEICVVTDDLDIEFGTVRFRKKGGAGTHNGMKSVIEQLGTQDFLRLRLGIGPKPPYMDAKDFVLARFLDQEQQQLPDFLALVAATLSDCLDKDVDLIMSAVNKKYF